MHRGRVYGNVISLGSLGTANLRRWERLMNHGPYDIRGGYIDGIDYIDYNVFVCPESMIP